MAVFVREDVIQALGIIDDLFSELDAAVMVHCLLHICGGGPGAQADGLAAPVCAAGGRFEGTGPDEFDAAG